MEPLSGHFGYLRVTLGHLMITLGSLWSYFGCSKVDFQKHSFSQIDFNDFIKLLGYFGVALGSFRDNFGAYEGDFGGTSGPLWGHFEHIDIEFHVWCMCHAYMYGLGGAENGKG